MAGYMRKLNGYVYEGSYAAGEELANGVFAELVADNDAIVVKKLTDAKGPTMRVKEITTLFTLPAVVLAVIDAGTDEVYFVENEWEIGDELNYDESAYTVKKGKFVKMHQPVKNDELIMSVADELASSLTIGALVQPAATGTIAAITDETDTPAAGA